MMIDPPVTQKKKRKEKKIPVLYHVKNYVVTEDVDSSWHASLRMVRRSWLATAK